MNTVEILNHYLHAAERRLKMFALSRGAAVTAIIALALTESPALFGVVVYAVSGWPQSWLFLLISAAGYLLNFPRRDDFS